MRINILLFVVLGNPLRDRRPGLGWGGSGNLHSPRLRPLLDFRKLPLSCARPVVEVLRTRRIQIGTDQRVARALAVLPRHDAQGVPWLSRIPFHTTSIHQHMQEKA